MAAWSVSGPSAGCGPGLNIRLATPADAPAITALLNTLIADRDGTALSVPLSIEQEAEYIRQWQRGGLCLLAEDAGLLLGFQSVDRLGPELGEIGTFIRRESRGLGVGRLLLQETRRWAQGEGVTFLLAVVAARNERGQRAYRAWGFTEASAGMLNNLGHAPDGVLLEFRTD